MASFQWVTFVFPLGFLGFPFAKMILANGNLVSAHGFLALARVFFVPEKGFAGLALGFLRLELGLGGSAIGFLWGALGFGGLAKVGRSLRERRRWLPRTRRSRRDRPTVLPCDKFS